MIGKRYDPNEIDPDIEPLIFFLSEQGYTTDACCSGYGKNAEGKEHEEGCSGYIQFIEDHGLCKKLFAKWSSLCEDNKPKVELSCLTNSGNMKEIVSWKLKDPKDLSSLRQVFLLIKTVAIRERNY